MLARTKRGLWRGLTALLVLVLCVSLLLGNILEANAGTIDTALGTISSGFVSEHDANNPLYDKFTPPEEFLTPTARATPTPSLRRPSTWAAGR